LAERGLTTASINMIIHRGHMKHRLQLPRPLKWTARIDTKQEISGPDILTIGAMAYPPRLNGLYRDPYGRH
jgi:hypothetical protein